jgi:lipopolysaccharide transport system ATP-binding protein
MNAPEAAPGPVAASLAIAASHLGKAYLPRATPLHRLAAALRRRPVEGEAFWALQDVSLEVRRGEAIGVVGRNGAGKSTLLQLLCGTLTPSTGSIQVDGRIAALLELGAGFNADFTGRENVLLNGPLLGLSRQQLQEKMESIIEFSGIGDFVDQPVKTYSSGMFVRLAFSLATAVEPDILVVDEALSVGDGGFARKSFDRILQMKERGATILFCSHSLYQVEAFCDRVVWLDHGRVMAQGEPHEVIRQYTLFLAGGAATATHAPESLLAGDAPAPQAEEAAQATPEQAAVVPTATPGHARITRVVTSVDGVAGRRFEVPSGAATLELRIEFESDPLMPAPTAGMAFELPNAIILSSVVSRTDGVALERDAQGRGVATIRFEKLALRKGEYHIGAYLGSEDALHLYTESPGVAILRVTDPRAEPGMVDLPHTWTTAAGVASSQ